MVIKIEIIVEEGKSYFNFEDENIKLSDVGVAMYQLEKAKDYLKKFEFECDIQIKEGYEDEEETP